MKHVVQSLILISSIHAPAVGFCDGGSGPATTPTHITSNKSVQGKLPLASFGARRPGADDPGDGPPNSPDDGLDLVIQNGEAKVCKARGGLLVCAAVEAPLPYGTKVRYWPLPDGTKALTYERFPASPTQVVLGSHDSRLRTMVPHGRYWPTQVATCLLTAAPVPMGSSMRYLTACPRSQRVIQTATTARSAAMGAATNPAEEEGEMTATVAVMTGAVATFLSLKSQATDRRPTHRPVAQVVATVVVAAAAMAGAPTIAALPHKL